jgi:hypothetical protein
VRPELRLPSGWSGFAESVDFGTKNYFKINEKLIFLIENL